MFSNAFILQKSKKTNDLFCLFMTYGTPPPRPVQGPRQKSTHRGGAWVIVEVGTGY